MYLHIGNKKSIKKEKIIGIFDLDTSTVSKETKKFINKKEKSCELIYEDFDLPRSFIVSDGGRVYLSRISSQGLKIRAEESKYE